MKQKKTKKVEFLRMLLGTLPDSVLGNVLASKPKIPGQRVRAGEETVRAGGGTIRADEGLTRTGQNF